MKHPRSFAESFIDGAVCVALGLYLCYLITPTWILDALWLLLVATIPIAK